MIPGNFISLTLDPKPFKSPESKPYDPISQLIRGGTRIGYGSDGRDVKDYLVELFTDGLINITDTTSNQIVYTKTLVNTKTISATFDNNMNVVLCYQLLDTSNLHYFDLESNKYITKVVNNTTSCKVCIDDIRLINNANSDIIFGYTKDDNLYYRQQRDKYDIERLIDPCQGKRLLRLGQTENNRLQFELQ